MEKQDGSQMTTSGRLHRRLSYSFPGKTRMVEVVGIVLLAQFREKPAYPLLAKIVSSPGEIPFDLFGDR
jgi:hypothetical protein